MKKKLLFTGGVLALVFVVLHLAFPKMFDWTNDLSHLTKINHGIFWIFHIAIIYLLVMSAIVCFKLAYKPTFTASERIVLISYAGFYLLRIALGPVFFGIELIIWLVCLLTALCYIVPVVIDIKNNKN
jgi:hypothetical protein